MPQKALRSRRAGSRTTSLASAWKAGTNASGNANPTAPHSRRSSDFAHASQSPTAPRWRSSPSCSDPRQQAFVVVWSNPPAGEGVTRHRWNPADTRAMEKHIGSFASVPTFSSGQSGCARRTAGWPTPDVGGAVAVNALIFDGRRLSDTTAPSSLSATANTKKA